MFIESESGILLGSDFLSRIHNIDYAALVMHAVYHGFGTLNKNKLSYTSPTRAVNISRIAANNSLN